MNRQKKRSITQTTNWYENLGRAALLGVLFTILAFQEFRPEGYESEKAALLVLFGCVLIAPQLLAVRSLLRHPVVLGVLGLVAVSALSTLVSISPGRSWWGAPDRAQGTLTLLVWALVFIQAALIGRRIEPDFIAVLVMIAIPLSLYSVLIQLNLDVGRPGSTTGNPNYLASWLALTALFIGQRLLRPTALRPLLIATLGLIGGALVLTASRGALVALVSGGFTLLILWTAVQGRRRGLLLLIGLAVVGGIAYIGIGSTLNARETDTGFARLFQPYDAFRLEAWQGAASVLNQQGEPFLDNTGQADPFASLRRIVGYGPDTVALMQSRYGELTTFQRENVYLNSFHNQIFDSLAMTGGLGLLAWLVIYGGAAFVVLRELDLVSRRTLPRWLLAQLAAALAGVAGMLILIPDTPLAAVAPLGLGVGSVAGLVIWVTVTSWRDQQRTVTARTILLIGLLSIVVAQWVDVQFGFMTLASGTLWWCLLGLLVATTADTDALPKAETNADPTLRTWLAATFCTGAVLIASFGSSIDSAIIEHSIGLTELPVLLLIVLGVGMTISLWTADEDADFKVWYLGLLLGGWVLLFAVKTLTNSIGGRGLDALFNGTTTTAPLLILALDVVVAALLILLAWLPRLRLQVAVGVSAALFVVGAVYYTTDYHSAILYAIGHTFGETSDPAYLAAADTLYAASDDFPYPNARLHLDWAVVLLKQGQQGMAEQQVAALLEESPFFIHTRDWALFARDYVEPAP